MHAGQTYNYLILSNIVPLNNFFVKLLFSYPPTPHSADKLLLSLLFGQHMAAYLWIDPLTQQPVKGAFYQLENWDGESLIDDFLSECGLDSDTPFSVQVCFDAPQITQMPVAQYERLRLDLLHKVTYPHQNTLLFLHESFANWQFYLCYSVPTILFRTLESRFSDLTYNHAIKGLLKDSSPNIVAGVIQLHVGIEQVLIVLSRNNRLLFTGYFNYRQELDIVYYLLRLSAAHGLSTDTVQLLLAGLIDPSSRLFEEISNYFLHVQTTDNSVCSDTEALPAHYFTLLTNNPVCAS
jgi:hypothetical protein